MNTFKKKQDKKVSTEKVEIKEEAKKIAKKIDKEVIVKIVEEQKPAETTDVAATAEPVALDRHGNPKKKVHARGRY